MMKRHKTVNDNITSSEPNNADSTIPSASQLLALSGISAADNPFGYATAIHWKSDLSSLWLQGVYHWQQLLKDAESSPWVPATLSQASAISHQTIDQLLLNPIRKKMSESAANQTQPDPFRDHNDQIESRYAVLLADLCRIFLKQGQFDQQHIRECFGSADKALQIFPLILELSVLEHSYHSAGLTRIVALKELYKTLLMAITSTPVSGKHPYRRYGPDNTPLDSFDNYLQSLRNRLQCLAEADAFDLVRFSEQPCGEIGCCEYQQIDCSALDFDFHGVSLRYYPATTDSKVEDTVLYLNSPLINRPEIYDLAPGKSVIEGLTKAGFGVYLVDYSELDRASNSLGLDFFGKHIHDHFIDLIKQRHPEQHLNVMGYCMGGCLILPYLARRAQELELQGKPMDIQKVLLMATPVRFDDETSGQKPMREQIRTWYNGDMLKDLLGDEKIPPQIIESGMNQIQPGVRYTLTRGFFERATNVDAIRDAAPFLFWLNHGTSFPAQAHREWISKLFMGNQLWTGKYCLPSTEATLDNQPVDMSALKRAMVKIMDYRGERDPISPKGSCVASETWGCNSHHHATTTTGLNRTIEKNIGHIFVVSKKHLGDYLKMAIEFYRDEDSTTS
ncbi:MAG: alpha/beta fold hydrolase [Motiliproteus sp.]